MAKAFPDGGRANLDKQGETKRGGWEGGEER